MIWFISDTHFGHELIFRKFRKKKYDLNDIQEHDEMLIMIWNNYIKDKDTVYFLGDFSFLGIPKTRDKILPRLKGKKIFIAGNHDRKRMRNLLGRFGEIHNDTLKINHKGKTFVLSHYPIEDWIGKRKGYIHVHGHIHKTGLFNREIRRIKNRYNACFEITGRPISIDEILTHYDKINNNILNNIISWIKRVARKLK